MAGRVPTSSLLCTPEVLCLPFSSHVGGIPQTVLWVAAPEVFLLGHRSHSMGSYVLGACSKMPGVLQSTPSRTVKPAVPSQLHAAGFVCAVVSMRISPILLTLDCGKDKALGMAYSSF